MKCSMQRWGVCGRVAADAACSQMGVAVVPAVGEKGSPCAALAGAKKLKIHLTVAVSPR